ncbi:MAG: DUF4344 domain-containing metallopeptidase [Oscillatoria sp. SIO1A7]|nr:DUF4344 domain-containing metallopeptidase [Oscillatoria sp. SIO1A7]
MGQMTLGTVGAIALLLTSSYAAFTASSGNAKTLPENRRFAPIQIEENQVSHQPKQHFNGGGFQVVYGPAGDRGQRFQNALRDARLFESLAEGLNSSNLNVPANIPIILRDCGQVNAFYRPADNSITMCHELTLDTVDLFSQSGGSSREEALEEALFVTIFVFFHELGHALIDVLEIPATGKEEDAVDDFATLLLLETDSEQVEEIVLNAARWFALQAERSEGSEIPYWGEHSLDWQRFYSIVCLVYGKNPSKYAALATKGILPRRRAERCPREYEKKLASWTTLLKPHFTNPNGTWGSPAQPPPGSYPPQNPPPNPRQPTPVPRW